jgi:hypothetical protein
MFKNSGSANIVHLDDINPSSKPEADIGQRIKQLFFIPRKGRMAASLYDFTVTMLNGQKVSSFKF